jgi:hypothetical protein
LYAAVKGCAALIVGTGASDLPPKMDATDVGQVVSAISLP